MVGVYGSSDPGFTPPLGDNSAMVSLKLACSPCFKRICPLGHTDCLEKLNSALVIETMESLSKDCTDLDKAETAKEDITQEHSH